MSNSTLKILPALMVAVAAALMTAQPVFGVTDHQLVFTENSSSSLSVTYDRSALTPTLVGPDFWSLPPGTIIVEGPLRWIEPENPLLANEFFALSPTNSLVASDSIFPSQVPFSAPDGFTFVGAGTDTSDGVPIDVTFHDLGDTVPDTGTTCSLFGLSLMGLAFLRRKLY